jgi:hypothetical protein
LTPNDPYRDRTAPLTSKLCILYIYSTNIGTEYFKHGVNSSVFSSSKYSLFHNSNVFGSCIIHILYIGCAKIKKNNSGAKRLTFKWQIPFSAQDNSCIYSASRHTQRNYASKGNSFGMLRVIVRPVCWRTWYDITWHDVYLLQLGFRPVTVVEGHVQK